MYSNQNRKCEVVVACERGTEGIAAQELRSFGWRPEILKRSKLYIPDVTETDLARLNMEVHTISRVYLLLARFRVSGLTEVRQAAESIDYTRFLKPGQRFGVWGKREGTHDFISQDIGRETGTAITRQFAGCPEDQRPWVHLNDPDVQFVAELSDEDLLLMINTSGRPLHHRMPRPFIHSAGLKPALAAALLRVSSWQSMGGFLDPFAGGGTIPLAAHLMCTGRAAGSYDDPDRFLLRNLMFLDQEAIARTFREITGKSVRPCGVAIHAADRFMKSIDGLKANLHHLDLRDKVTIHHGIAENLNYLPKDTVRCVVTNPPYGLRIGRPFVIDLIYKNFALACARKGIHEVTALTPRKRSWVSAFENAGYTEEVCMKIVFGRLQVFLLKVARKP